MKRRMRAALVLFAALTVALVELTSAQGTSGSLTGQVVDPSGAAIPGVTVTVTNPSEYPDGKIASVREPMPEPCSSPSAAMPDSAAPCT